jgi:hypothetical protein
MPMEFWMLLPRRPIAANKNMNPKYAQALRDAASSRMNGRATLRGSLYARVVWMHRVATRQDVDNIIKRILDALKGVVFADDFAVTHCMSARIDARAGLTFDATRIDADVYAALLSMYATETDHMLYVEVGCADPIMTTGPLIAPGDF